MNTTINSYLNLNGKCREAMNFYKDCLGGELTMQTVGDSPVASQCPSGTEHLILHSTLQKGDMVLMASDLSHEQYTYGNNMALSVNCTSENEINQFFTKLSEGGTVIDPLKQQFWGAIFGVVNDKYGIRWMFNYNINQSPS